LTDWSNWQFGSDVPYYGILDSCTASDSESVTAFSWNPVPSDTNKLFWGSTSNGSPQVDWMATEATPSNKY